jgi:hypothetical protein
MLRTIEGKCVHIKATSAIVAFQEMRRNQLRVAAGRNLAIRVGLLSGLGIETI